jgi:hypothetical protein
VDFWNLQRGVFVPNELPGEARNNPRHRLAEHFPVRGVQLGSFGIENHGGGHRVAGLGQIGI